MKDNRTALVEEYRKISRETDKLANSGDKEKAVVILKEWQNKAKQNGDRDYELFFQAELINYTKNNPQQQIELMQDAFAWAEKHGLSADFFLYRSISVYHAQDKNLDLAMEYVNKALKENPDEYAEPRMDQSQQR